MFRLYIPVMWLVDRLLWLACFAECPHNPEKARIDAIRSLIVIQNSDLSRLFGQKVRVMDDLDNPL